MELENCMYVSLVLIIDFFMDSYFLFSSQGSASPQVSVPSPLPNGIVSSPSGGMGLKGFHINHMTVSPASRNSSPSPSPTSAEFSPAATGGHFQKLTG